MDLGDCLEGKAVTVAAADDFYKYIDGWHGVVGKDHQAGAIRIHCINAEGTPVQFLVPPEQLREGHL